MRSPPTSEGKLPERRECFRRRHRLLRRHEYQRVQRQGLKASTRSLLLLYLKNGLEYSRLGVAASRKFGGAVQRNRFKRVVREVFRRNRGLFPDCHDLVVIPKKGASPVSYQELLREMRILSRRAWR